MTSTFEEYDQLDIPEDLPVLPVRDMVVFPDMIAPLFVGRELSLGAVEKALSGQRLVMLATQRHVTDENPRAEDLFDVGTVGLVVRMRRLPDDRLKILVQGLRKARIDSMVQERPYFAARVRPIVDLPLDELSVETEALMRSLKDKLHNYSATSEQFGPDVLRALEGLKDPGRLADLTAANLALPVAAGQEVLELPDPVKRLRKVIEHLMHELEVNSTRSRIETRMKDSLGEARREFYLREQMKQIRSELGEVAEDDTAELERHLRQAGLPEAVQAEADKQLKRLLRMSPESSEAATLRTYLEWLGDMPWKAPPTDKVDLARSLAILDEDHLGLEQAKDRVIEHLAVRKLNPDSPAPILCFVGPPGVGKTSLGQSIARALDRPFGRIALGGVRDEAEIRGHRRTYVGAMPGRIAQAIKQAGAVNPVLVLDEVDKIGRDMRGDPTAALLEVLDPEQNHAFVDHYLNVPIDLSKVLFVTTANRVDTIPPALLDRMEVIELSGYTPEEKKAIAGRFLLPRQRTRCGLEEAQVELSPETLDWLVERYTQEAGLRQLEQVLGRICRKVARQVGEGKELGLFEAASLAELLGPTMHRPLECLKEDVVGVVHGLAWTPAGGQVLQVEAARMRGSGRLILTGQLGEVMKESAQTALSHVRSLEEGLSLLPAFFDSADLHIHVPAGAIPKDGPSAGLAMGVALVSLASDRPVRRRVAMTGEITLRGRILPVGGVREKILAANRAGLTEVVLPEQNAEDLSLLPAAIREGMEIHLVATLEQALELALEKGSA